MSQINRERFKKLLTESFRKMLVLTGSALSPNDLAIHSHSSSGNHSFDIIKFCLNPIHIQVMGHWFGNYVELPLENVEAFCRSYFRYTNCILIMDDNIIYNAKIFVSQGGTYYEYVVLASLAGLHVSTLTIDDVVLALKRASNIKAYTFNYDHIYDEIGPAITGLSLEDLIAHGSDQSQQNNVFIRELGVFLKNPTEYADGYVVARKANKLPLGAKK